MPVLSRFCIVWFVENEMRALKQVNQTLNSK